MKDFLLCVALISIAALWVALMALDHRLSAIEDRLRREDRRR